MIIPKKARKEDWALWRSINFGTEHLAEIVIPLDDPRRGSRVEARRRELREGLNRALEANREVPDIVGRATLSNRIKQGRHYTVLLTCSLCGHTQRVVSRGWSAILCPGCKSGLERGPYKRDHHRKDG